MQRPRHLSGDQIIERASPAVVLILAGSGDGKVAAIGSGLIVRADGAVLIANHVVKGMREIQIRLKNGEVYDRVELIAADDRRDIAALRQLAHTRSLVANANVRNRPGMGTALRCMLEMHAFSEYVLKGNRLEDARLLEKLYHGRAFTPGGWYDIEKWESQEGQPPSQDDKEAIKALLNLPRVGDMVRPVHDADKGASYLYSVYSEFVHPAFGRPKIVRQRLELERYFLSAHLNFIRLSWKPRSQLQCSQRISTRAVSVFDYSGHDC